MPISPPFTISYGKESNMLKFPQQGLIVYYLSSPISILKGFKGVESFIMERTEFKIDTYTLNIYERTRDPCGKKISQWARFHRKGWL